MNSEKVFSTEKKLNRNIHLYNLKFKKLKKQENKTLQSSPEKECSMINELVKKSVEKINNLFLQQKLSEMENKSFNSNSVNIKNINNKRGVINYNSIDTLEQKIKNDDDLSENLSQNINSSSLVDVSAIKRNVKQHSFDFKHLFKVKKDSKNQIDYIQKSKKGEKKYIIKSLLNQKAELDLNESKNNTPIKTEKNYLFQSDIIKNLSNEKFYLDENINTKENRRNKYYSFYRNNNAKNAKNNYDLINRKKYFEDDNSKSFTINVKGIHNDRYNSVRKNNYINYTNINISKNSTKFNFTKVSIQKTINFKISSSPFYTNPKKRLISSKTQSHFTNTNNSQVFKQFYSKEFPNKTKTNDILKLMLFLNEYIINNNLLDDYYIENNRKILDDYSKFLAVKININYPNEQDITCDDFINKTKLIQRNWRQLKVKNYIERNKYNEQNEIKKMVMNNYVINAGYKLKKIFGLFHNLVEQFNILEKNEDFNINKCLYLTKKIITNNLNNFEKYELYKDYINKIIFMN